MALECGKVELPVFSDEVVGKLTSYSWPGNVRELKNVIERAVYRSEGEVITEVEFNPFDNPYAKKKDEIKAEKEESKMETLPAQTGRLEALPLSDYGYATEQLDVIFLSRALTEAAGNQKLAAEKLNLTYDQFRGLYRKYKSRLKA